MSRNPQKCQREVVKAGGYFLRRNTHASNIGSISRTLPFSDDLLRE